MAEVQERETKLIQYLNEAYGKEQELVTALQAHISLTSRDAYKKRLKDHLKETKAQAKGLERRIKQLGGKAERIDLPGPDGLSDAAGKAQATAQKALAAAKGPLHALRGTGEAEKMLKNAKTEFFNEAEEIANYHAIEALAEAVGDRDTAKLAREFRRQEERMAKFLERTITSLTKEVVRDEIPASQRKRNGGTRRRASSSSRAKAGSAKAGATKATSAKAGTAKAGSAKRTATPRKRAPSRSRAKRS
jgi:ferritin-like metal-binding protein YciE